MKMKKIISLMLVVILALGSITFCASAAGRHYYVVLGDSIAYGSGLVNATEACYGKMVADTCGFDYDNHAVPGDTTADLIAVLGNGGVLNDIAEADIVSISIGGNDFLSADLTGLMYDSIVKRDYTEFDRIGDGVYTNVKEIIKIIRRYNSDALILLQTLYNPQFGYLKEAYQQAVDRVNASICRCADESRLVEVVDVASALNGDERNFADDTLHPSARGNEIIAKTVLAKLNSLGYTSKTKLNARLPGIDVVLGEAPSKALEFYAFILQVIAKALDSIYVFVE